MTSSTVSGCGSAGVDAAILAAAFTVLLGATFLAAWLPARRATRVSPTLALRAD